MTLLEEYDAALDALTHAKRHGSEEDQKACAQNLEEIQDRLAQWGLVFLRLAIERLPTYTSRALKRLVDDVVAHAVAVAESARRSAQFAADEAAALRERVRLLEEQIARLTPGLGDPDGTRLAQDRPREGTTDHRGTNGKAHPTPHGTG